MNSLFFAICAPNAEKLDEEPQRQACMQKKLEDKRDVSF